MVCGLWPGWECVHLCPAAKVPKVVGRVTSRMMAFLTSNSLLMGHEQCHKHSDRTSHMKMRCVCVLWVTCPKSVIGVTSHGSYTSLALLFLANL